MLLFVPISSIAYSTLPQEQNGDAAALFSMARNVFGGLGISISTALITDHEQLRQAHLIDRLSPGNPAYEDLLQKVQHALYDSGQSMSQAIHNAPAQVFGMLQTQTAILAYNDVFLITGCAALVLIPTALLMSGVKPKAAGGAH
jgi:DHA2 family multidrug resistance protein